MVRSFFSLGVLIGARAYASQGQIRFYDVSDDGLLYLVDVEAKVMRLVSENPLGLLLGWTRRFS